MQSCLRHSVICFMEATSQTIVFVLLFQLFVKNSESRVGGVGMHCASSDNKMHERELLFNCPNTGNKETHLLILCSYIFMNTLHKMQQHKDVYCALVLTKHIRSPTQTHIH